MTSLSHVEKSLAAVIRGPGDITVYLNGVDDGGIISGTLTAALPAVGPAKIGRADTAIFSESFAGSIDEVLLFNRELSPSEIAGLMDFCATESGRNRNEFRQGGFKGGLSSI